MSSIVSSAVHSVSPRTRADYAKRTKALNFDLNFDSESLQSVTKRLSKIERETIASKIEEVFAKPGSQKQMKEITLRIQGGIGRDPKIVNVEDFDTFVMSALMKGDITLEQFSSTMIFKAAFQQEQDITPIELFGRNGRINHKAFVLIQATVEKNVSEILTEQVIETFFELMKDKPKSEQILHLMPNNTKWEDIYEYLESPDLSLISIAQVIKIQAHFSLLGTDSNSWKIFIPSFSMMQAMLDATCGENACKISPVIGTTTADDIKNDMSCSKRDMAIPYQGFPLPTKADGYSASSFEFIYHDFYHLYILSKIPASHRKAFQQIALAIEKVGRKISSECSEANQTKQYLEMGLSWFTEKVIDADFPSYRLKKKEGNLCVFWQSIATAAHRSLYSRLEQEGLDLKFGKILTEAFQEKKFYFMIGKEITKHLPTWERQGIASKQSLEKVVQDTKNKQADRLKSLPGFPHSRISSVLDAIPIVRIHKGIEEALKENAPDKG